jgi:hypothetical protein
MTEPNGILRILAELRIPRAAELSRTHRAAQHRAILFFSWPWIPFLRLHQHPTNLAPKSNSIIVVPVALYYLLWRATAALNLSNSRQLSIRGAYIYST